MGTYLLSGSGAIVDQHQGGDDVDGQADDGDEVGSDPGWHVSYQPLPEVLHERLQEGASCTAVLVLLQLLQLVNRERRRGHLNQLAQGTTYTAAATATGCGLALDGGRLKWSFNAWIQ